MEQDPREVRQPLSLHAVMLQMSHNITEAEAAKSQLAADSKLAAIKRYHVQYNELVDKINSALYSPVNNQLEEQIRYGEPFSSMLIDLPVQTSSFLLVEVVNRFKTAGWEIAVYNRPDKTKLTLQIGVRYK